MIEHVGRDVTVHLRTGETHTGRLEEVVSGDRGPFLLWLREPGYGMRRIGAEWVTDVRRVA